MSDETTEAEPDRRTLAELSALADGTLEPKRARRLRQLIAESPELSARYQQERRAVAALQSLTADRAPARLRMAVEARRHRVPRRRGRLLYSAALATAAAAAVALLVLLLPGGSPGAPAVSQAAALALRGPALAAPADHGTKLAASVGETYFPNWGWSGWQPSGERIDRLSGKLAVTVYYKHGGTEIAYTILATPPLSWPGPQMIHVDGLAIQSFTFRGRLVVTWRRTGHTCVLSGTGVTRAQLAALASWKAAGLDE